MPFHHAPLTDDNRATMQRIINSGDFPFPPPAIPDSWWVDADRDAALWAVPAALRPVLARSRAQELTRVIVPAMDSA